MKKNNKGFSLIELSIVLIIMGLLIAGVTGGASLIKSAQLRAVVTENTSFRTAYNTYYAQFGKVPGSDADLNTIDDAGDPWQNLFDEGIIDKKPETETGSAGGNTVKYVNSKFGKNAKWFLKNAGDSFVVSDFSNINVLILSGKSDFSTGALTNREAESVDDKIDDGQSTTGIIRGLSYETSTATNADYAGSTTAESARIWSFVNKLDF